MQQLEARKKDVARWVVEAAKTAQISASRRQALQSQFQKLPTFLGELQPTMAKLGDLADQQTPLLRDLQRAAPDLNTFFTQLGPFTKASRPAFQSLGQTSITGKKALNDSRRDVDQLAALAADAPRVGKPLRQFLQTLDTRSRTTEPDVRAKDQRAARARPDGVHVEQAGLHRLRGLLELRLLADAGDQPDGRGRPRAARPLHPRLALRELPDGRRLQDRPEGQGAVRQVQLVARALPAGRQREGPDG